jgi:hypothetical protein
MSENSPKDGKSESPEVVKKSEVGSPKSEEEGNSAIGIPKSEINELPTANSKLPTETMEVHHHPRIEKKGFKEYSMEGLMIFLAVTMGFFAENIRENISENGNAHELAKSLYQEVYADSVTMQYKIKVRQIKEAQTAYFKKYVRDSSMVHLSDKFYPSFFWAYSITSAQVFEPNDGIINQLRNSGALRYFKSIELQNAISQIDEAILNIRNRNTDEKTFVESFTRPFLLKYYDFDWEDEYKEHGKRLNMIVRLKTNFHPATPPYIRNIRDFKKDDAYALATNYLQMLTVTRQVFYDPYIEANHRLLQVLRKEYRIENE